MSRIQLRSRLIPMLLVAVAAVVAVGAAGRADAAVRVASPPTAFDTNLYVAFKSCLAGSVRSDAVEPGLVYQCLGGRGYSAVAIAPAGPGNLTTRTPAPSAFEIDLFSTFTSCLSEAAHSDSMYPGINPREVNSCLERHGF